MKQTEIQINITYCIVVL